MDDESEHFRSGKGVKSFEFWKNDRFLILERQERFQLSFVYIYSKPNLWDSFNSIFINDYDYLSRYHYKP